VTQIYVAHTVGCSVRRFFISDNKFLHAFYSKSNSRANNIVSTRWVKTFLFHRFPPWKRYLFTFSRAVFQGDVRNLYIKWCKAQQMSADIMSWSDRLAHGVYCYRLAPAAWGACSLGQMQPYRRLERGAPSQSAVFAPTQAAWRPVPLSPLLAAAGFAVFVTAPSKIRILIVSDLIRALWVYRCHHLCLNSSFELVANKIQECRTASKSSGFALNVVSISNFPIGKTHYLFDTYNLVVFFSHSFLFIYLQSWQTKRRNNRVSLIGDLRYRKIVIIKQMRDALNNVLCDLLWFF